MATQLRLLRASPIALSLVFLAACQTAEKPASIKPPSLPAGPAPSGSPSPASPLSGRVIALDPGHGGPWAGAIAPANGLRECDVNLHVALRLKRLLADAGATVVLTRETDTALDESSLAADLAARPAIAHKAGAEIFVSIHHNANGFPDSRDDLEVYYNMSDDGPSMDLAQSLTWELARRLRRDAAAKSLLPGNYKVLRESETPSVLLESFYLTDAKSARFLASEDGVRAEAEAIAAGILQYFAKQPPRVLEGATTELDGSGVHKTVLRLAPGPTIDPGTVQARLNQLLQPGHAVTRAEAVEWAFARPFPNGKGRLTVQGRNPAGVAFLYATDIDINRPPARLAFQQGPQEASAANQTMACVSVTDSLGMPVADGVTVACNEAGASEKTIDGTVRFYLKPGSRHNALTITCGSLRESFPLTRGDAFKTIRVRNARTQRPIPGIYVEADGRIAAAGAPEGWAAISNAITTCVVRANGYEPLNAKLVAPHTDLLLQPAYDGVLIGKKITIDPAYGGRVPGAVGPSGVRACDINMDVARRAAAWLTQAGAEIALTRDTDADMSDMQRVALSEQFQAELYVCISFGPFRDPRTNAGESNPNRRSAFAGHYHSSVRGKRLAEALAQNVGKLSVASTGSLVIQQTSCPSALLQPATIEDAAAEETFQNAANRQKIAEGISRGILEYIRSESSR